MERLRDISEQTSEVAMASEVCLFGCYNALSDSFSPTAGKDAKLAKVNYQYEKRQKEIEKKRKKEQKEKEKLKRKNNPSQDAQSTPEAQETPKAQSPEK